MFKTLLKILFYLSFSSIFCHLWLDGHFHVYLGIYLDDNLIILLDDFCCCHNNLPSDFSWILFFIWDRGSNTPELLSLFKRVSNVNKISWSYDKHFVVRKINYLSITVRGLDLLIIFVDVRIKCLLNFKII